MIYAIYSKRIFALFVHWFFQGILYADKTERAFRFSIDASLTLIFFSIFSTFMRSSVGMILAFIIAHTLNSFLNGQIFVVERHFSTSRNSQNVATYIEGFKKRIIKEQSIQAAAIYGSYSRGEAKENSDVDVRIIRRCGVINGLRACSFGLLERTRALLNKIPLDLYVVDSTKHLLKLRKDEVPIVLYDPSGVLNISAKKAGSLESN